MRPEISSLFFNNSNRSFTRNEGAPIMTSHRLDEHKCSLNASIATFHHLKLASRLSPGYCCFSCDAIISARDRLKRTDVNPGLHTHTQLPWRPWNCGRQTVAGHLWASQADWCVVNGVCVVFCRQATFVASDAIC